MTNKRFKNLIYFQNGSIGDFLMTIFFLENIYLNEEKANIYVVVPKSDKFLSQFLVKYPYIKIILANKRSLKGFLGVLRVLGFLFSKNLVLTSPTTGHLPLFEKIIAKIISSYLIGFDDDQKINKYIYDKLFDYDTKTIYPEFLKKVIKDLGFDIKKEKPFLECSRDESILKDLDLENRKFVVFNPLAATRGRSLKEDEISEIIDFVKIFSVCEGIEVILTGGGRDVDVLNKFGDKAIVLINPRIAKLCALLNNTELFIGVDTGTSHIASFLSVKSLVVAQNGTPNWLPYYNKNATILYNIKHCKHNIFEGREHLEECRGKILRCLGYVPVSVIKKYINEIIK